MSSRRTPNLLRLLGWAACVALMLLIFGYIGMMVGGLFGMSFALVGTAVGLFIGFLIGHVLGSALFFPRPTRDYT